MESLLVLIAGVLFVGTHLGVSSTGLRDRTIAAVGGLSTYLGVYSLISAVTLGLLIWAYARAPHGPLIWSGLEAITKFVIMPVSLFFIVGGFTTRNPTAVGAEGALGGDAARGLLRITRHPVMWGFALWAFGHMLANGDINSLLFFSSILIVAAYGMVLLDRRKSLAKNWLPYANATSVMPFAAIRSGRNHFMPNELIVPAVIALVLYAVLLWAHPYVSGGIAIA